MRLDTPWDKGASLSVVLFRVPIPIQPSSFFLSPFPTTRPRNNREEAAPHFCATDPQSLCSDFFILGYFLSLSPFPIEFECVPGLRFLLPSFFFPVQIGKTNVSPFFLLVRNIRVTLCVFGVYGAWGFWVRDIVESFFGDFFFFYFLSLPLNFNRGGYTKHLSDISFSLVREREREKQVKVFFSLSPFLSPHPIESFAAVPFSPVYLLCKKGMIGQGMFHSKENNTKERNNPP